MGDWPQWAAGWTPVVERRTTTIAQHPVAGLAALLDADETVACIGAPLPLLWHWVAVSEWPPSSVVGADGHPATGDFMPPTPYPRRMWLGCSLDVARPLAIGDAVAVERSVTDLVEKSGSAGRFAIATVTTTVSSATGETLVTERTQFAYRPNPAIPPTAAAAPVADQALLSPRLRREAPGRWSLHPDPVMLMRFSALTGNGHRIHYDVPYTTQIEGYPNLVVHGPLMATMLAEVARREYPDHELTGFSCRAQRPLFLGTAATIEVAATDGGASLSLRDVAAPAEGAAGMTAEVRFR